MQVRHRPVRRGVRSYRVDQVFGNHVAGKRRAQELSRVVGVGSGAERVMNHLQGSRWIEVLGKISRSLSRGGHREQAEPARIVDVPFERSEEKRFVLDNGPPEGASVLVDMQG